MTRRLLDLTRGLAGLVLLLGLVIGMPVALAIAVGWPLPTSMPSLSGLGEALSTTGVDDLVVVKTVARVMWLAWLHVAAAVALELVALARRRPAPNLRGARTVQLAVGRLVASVALIGSAFTTPRAAMVTSSPLPIAIVTSATASMTSAPVQMSEATAEAGPVYVVQRHDSLWSIAETRLGDGLRWREIRDLNAGRVMPGGAVVDPTGDVIHPGWELRLPAAGDTAAPVTPSMTVRVELGDSMWTVAEDTAPAVLGHEPDDVELHDHWRDLIEVNHDRLVDPADPGRIYVGQELAIPGASPEVAEVLASPPPMTPASTAEPSPTSVAPSPPVIGESDADPAADEGDAADEDSGAWSTRLGVAGAGLATALLAGLRQARRRRLAHVPQGFAPAPPGDDLDDVRTEIVLAADDDAIERRNGALRELARSLAPHDAVRPRLVRVAPERVEVLLSRPAVPAPVPWTVEGGGAVWSTAEDLRVTPGVDVAPALVAIGVPDGADQLYLDLEAMAVVGLTGETEATVNLLRSVVVELRAMGTQVYAVECGLDGLLDVDDVTWDEIADDLLARADQSSALLEANRWPTPLHARGVRGEDDALTATVVVLGAVPNDPRFDQLCRRIAGSPSTVTVVVLGEHPAAVSIEVSDGLLRIPSLGLTCHAQQLGAESAAEVTELWAEPDGQLVLLADMDPARRMLDLSDAIVQRPDILVRLLGEIDVIGGRRPLQPKQTAVMAYIALHSPVTTERIEDAVWPTATSSRRKRLANTISECRSRLGASYLPIAGDGRYTLGPGVGTDLHEFERLEHLAEQASDSDAIALLRQAMDLVRGPVFTYRSGDRASFVWIDLENWLTTWELKVTNVALRLSDLALDAGDVETARWSAEQGLLSIPTHTALTEALMRAYWRNGDREAAEKVYVSHVAALEELEIDEVADTTIDLREEIRAARSS